MAQKGFTVDVNQCTSCRACEAACKVEYNLQVGQGRRRRVVEKTVVEAGVVRTFFTSLACNHCAQPACVKACPVGAYVKYVHNDTVTESWQRDEAWMNATHGSGPDYSKIKGVVLHDPAKCIGCRRCEWACPYGAPQFNPDVKKIHKCEACWQRIVNTDLHSSRQVPACVATCIGRSIHWDDVDPEANPEAYDYDYALGARDFVRPGQAGVSEPGVVNDGRGSSYPASYTLTKPALKIRNRVYRKRDGGWE